MLSRLSILLFLSVFASLSCLAQDDEDDDTRFECRYDAQKKKKYCLLSEWYRGGGSKSLYTYNSKQQLIKSEKVLSDVGIDDIEDYKNEGGLEIESRTVYEYDTKGRPIKISDSTDNKALPALTVYSYDNTTRRLKTINRIDYKNELMGSVVISYKNGLVEKTFAFYAINNEYEEVFYQKVGQTKRNFNKMQTGELFPAFYSYKHDSIYIYNSEKKLTKSTHYWYNKAGIIIKNIDLDWKRNITWHREDLFTRDGKQVILIKFPDGRLHFKTIIDNAADSEIVLEYEYVENKMTGWIERTRRANYATDLSAVRKNAKGEIIETLKVEGN